MICDEAWVGWRPSNLMPEAYRAGPGKALSANRECPFATASSTLPLSRVRFSDVRCIDRPAAAPSRRPVDRLFRQLVVVLVMSAQEDRAGTRPSINLPEMRCGPGMTE